MKIDALPSNKIIVDNKSYLYFSGTQYLGLSHHPKFQEAIAVGVKKYGASIGSSRRGKYVLRAYSQLEERLADFIGVSKVITISSGTLAGMLVGNYLKSKDMEVAVYPKIHPCIGVVSEPNEASFIEKTNQYNTALVNAVNPIVAHVFDTKTPPSLNLMVDDSHGIGVLGETGSGFKSYGQSKFNVQLLFGSLSKAMGVVGGFIGGEDDMVDQIERSSVFGGASPMSPVLAYALSVSFDLVREQHVVLMENLNYFHDSLPKNWPVSFNPDVPIFIFPNHVGELLFKEGVFISALQYPTKNDPLINRVVLNALHKKEDMDYLLEKLTKIFN